MQSTANWKSPTGASYEFEVHDPATVQWSGNAGIYLFSYRGLDTSWWPLYVGKTKCFRDRPGQHERWQEARSRGATTILARVVHLESARDRLEAALIAHFNPVMNTQLRTGLPALMLQRA